jgi:D-glycero-alpha-D-manno-heptose-7-phosphate kinase
MHERWKMIKAKAPLRVDFAGGTTDIPPLFLLHWPAPVVNAAITLYATATIAPSKKFTIISRDQGIAVSFKNQKSANFKRRPELELLIRLAKLFPLTRNICIEVNSEAPHGSGLGASSAIAVALVAALAAWTGRRLSGQKVVEYAKSAETQTIKVPTGYQDYWAAWYGGANSYRMSLGGTVERRSFVKRAFLKNIEHHLILVYAGEPHFSGMNNWELFKKHFDGGKRTIHFFKTLKENAVRMEEAFRNRSVEKIAREMNRDWQTRKSMLPSMTTPGIERLTRFAFKNGALGLRTCGAGGGGCVAILACPESRNPLMEKIKKAGMQVFPVKVARGIVVKKLK